MRRSRTQYGRFRLSHSALAWMVLFWCACIILGPGDDGVTTRAVGTVRMAQAKEIEATHEWQLLGENDTVAAGMHIRMDMTTGEKWVKLPDENDDENQAADSSSSSRGLAVISDNGEQETQEETAPAGDPDPEYNFEMMHRTLSQLPEEDKERMQLPKLPDSVSSVHSLSPEARVIFEARLKQIWEDRQEELRAMEREFVADMPQILKDRIQSLHEYLEDPVAHLHELAARRITDDDGDASSSSSDAADNEDNGSIIDIVDVLRDLEYQLTDVDMARDFHTLGGWSILASLLSDTVHAAATTTTTTTTTIRPNNHTTATLVDSESIRASIHRVQMHAAWALGSAVKNTAEFGPYVIEPVAIRGADTTDADPKPTTALDLALQQFQTFRTTAPSHTTTEQQKLLKVMYCLGSFLRGNRAAQIHFGAAGGPATLSTALQALLDQSDTPWSSFVRKMSHRLLNLASDTVTDVVLHASHDEETDGEGRRRGLGQLDAAIVDAYTSEAWCDAVQKALVSLRDETALRTVHTLAPHCASSSSSAAAAAWSKGAIAELGNTLVQLRGEWKAEAELHHPEILQERFDLAEATLQLLQDSGSGAAET